MTTERPFKPSEQGEREFIESRWDEFVKGASTGYERFGRGVVLVTVRPPDEPAKTGRIEYVNHSEADRVWPDRGWPEPATERAVADYDPEKGFLVLILDHDARTCRLHRFESDTPLSPPDTATAS